MHAFDREVGEAEAGQRLDVWLVRHVPAMSRAKARDLASAGKIRINGRRARKGVRVQPGDRVTLEELPRSGAFEASPDPDLVLPLLHVDDHLVVVDKPAGVPSHPLRPEEVGTAAGALVARFPEMTGVGYSPREPGLLHRLDTDTSGVLLVARDADTFEALRADLEGGRMDKRYLALCAGAVSAPAVVDVPLASDPADARRVLACPDPAEAARRRARPGRTEILSARPIEGGLTLIEVRATRAGRHQIRAHLSHVGHPLAGDALYGGPSLPGLARHFLHASSITLRHPVHGGTVTIESPLPSELQALLA